MSFSINIADVVDVIGTLVFAISGALAAAEKKFDLMGVAIIAFVTALGGGTVRDMLIGAHPVGWMQNYAPITIVTIGVLLVFLFYKKLHYFRKTFFLFDAIGLGAFAIGGLEKALSFGVSPGYAVICGMITACFGGVVRDVLCNEIPLIFRKEIYALAGLIGAGMYLGLDYLGVSSVVNFPITVALVAAIRMLAVYKDLRLPIIKLNS